MRLTSVSIVLEPGNIRERKITIIIERCSRSTSWDQISLFALTEEIKDLSLYQCQPFGSHYNGYQLLSSQRGLRVPRDYFHLSLIHLYLVVGQWVYQSSL